MTQGKGTAKEVHKLLKSARKMSDGQARVTCWDPDNVDTIIVEVKPNDGVYKGGTFEFEIKMGEDFPFKPPTVRCLTRVYHPNIDPTDECEDTNVCLNMFDSDQWQESYGILGTIQGLLFLFHNPNLEDPLSPFFDPCMTNDEFEDNVQKSLRGEEVEGFQFMWNFIGENEEPIKSEPEDEEKISKRSEVIEEEQKEEEKCKRDSSIVDPPQVETTMQGEDLSLIHDKAAQEQLKGESYSSVDLNSGTEVCNNNNSKNEMSAQEEHSLTGAVSMTASVNNEIPHVGVTHKAAGALGQVAGTDLKMDLKLADQLLQYSNQPEEISNQTLARSIQYQTFDGFSPETDVMLFFFSKIVSKLSRTEVDI